LPFSAHISGTGRRSVTEKDRRKNVKKRWILKVVSDILYKMGVKKYFVLHR